MKTCKKHPRYKVIRKPTAKCLHCRLLWAWRCVRKALGLSVPKLRRAPKMFCSELVMGLKPVRPETFIPIFYKRLASDPAMLAPHVFPDNMGSTISDPRDIVVPVSELPVAPENRGPE